MNREDVICWANECGFRIDAEDFVRPREGDYALRLARFASLAVAAERDRACQIVTGLCISDNNAREINEAIRGKE